jgi:hypothetical protein
MSEIFNDKELELEYYWRSIILRGRNVASYKFVLAALVAHLKKQERTEVKVREKQLNDATAKTISLKQQDEVITLIAKLAKFK